MTFKSKKMNYLELGRVNMGEIKHLRGHKVILTTSFEKSFEKLCESSGQSIPEPMCIYRIKRAYGRLNGRVYVTLKEIKSMEVTMKNDDKFFGMEYKTNIEFPIENFSFVSSSILGETKKEIVEMPKMVGLDTYVLSVYKLEKN